MAKKNVLASAATSASYNMILQLTFRVLTFVLNAIVLRYISKELLGVVNVRLMLLYSTTVFVTREAFRRACLSKTGDRNWPQVINLLWCTVPICILCASILGYIWMFVLEQPSVNNYRFGVFCFALSTVIEMLSEPIWVIGQALLFVRLRVFIEGFALAARCICTVFFVIVFPEWGLVPFAIAQVLYTSIYTMLYYIYFINYISKAPENVEDFPFKSVSDLLPNKIPGKLLISWDLAGLTWSFFKQSFLKQLLTEGERYVMTIFNVVSFADQGIYDIINNLGSLAARFIFLPIEDSGYLFFSQTLQRGIGGKPQASNESFKLATQVLESLLKIVTLIGLIFLVYGYAYSYLLLDIYGGSVLSSGSGPNLLRWYCVYVIFIAVNGTTECFVFAAMSKEDVDRFNKKMLLFSCIFLFSSWYLTTQIGSVGFIIANCLNMAARIIHSIYYIENFYKDTGRSPLNGLKLSLPVLLSLMSSWVITAISEMYFCCDKGVLFKFLHIVIGGLSLLAVLSWTYLTEKTLLKFIKDQYRQRYSTEVPHDIKED